MRKGERIRLLSRRLAGTWYRPRVLASLLGHSNVTCSQFGEDIVFDRLMMPGDEGTFVDVGANHPVHGSNTYRMYARGWRGLAIDPNPQFAGLFRTYRPHDVYRAEGVSAQPTSLTYFQFDNDVFNTLDDARVAQLRDQGIAPLRQTTIPCRPLATIIADTLGDRQIDLLNVDCEGMDLEAIDSIDLVANRPTVIIVEDYQKYLTFRDGAPAGAFERAMRERDYAPIAQTAWSAIFVATDWRRLFARSNAYAEDRVVNGYLPGQAELGDD